MRSRGVRRKVDVGRRRGAIDRRCQMTTIEAHLPTAGTAERLTRGVVVLLIGAPLLMAVAHVLLVPFDDQDWDAVLTSMANHQGRSDAGWLMAMAASGLLAVTAVILARRLGDRRPHSSRDVRDGHDRDRLGSLRRNLPRWSLPVGRCDGAGP